MTERSEEQFWQLVKGRRSLRRYQEDEVDAELLTKILEAATWAPSAHNRQPWRFCVVTSSETKAALSLRMGERWRRDLGADGADPAFIERRVSISHARITTAAALVVASVCMDDMDVYGDAARTEIDRNEAEWLMAVQSVSLACQNLLLATHHYGLGACWMCAPLFVPQLVRDVLHLPAEWHPQALITIGVPAVGHTAQDKEKERVPIQDRVVWR